MSKADKPKQRVVSKLGYVGYLAKREALLWTAIAIMVCGAAVLLVSVLGMAGVFLWYFLFCREPPGAYFSAFCLSMLAGLLVSGLAVYMMRAGYTMIQRADWMQEVVPLTQRTAEQLPAAESLVRASSEPPESAETVLLRAALSSPETPAEQLLRSSQSE